MFRKILSGLGRSAPDVSASPPARLALAALLVRVARADDEFHQTEAQAIDRFLADHFGLGAFAAVALRQEAEVLEADAPDTVRFTRTLKEAVPHEDRVALLEALWSVALSDGKRSSDEDATLRLVANLLGINDRDSALARQRMDKS